MSWPGTKCLRRRRSVPDVPVSSLQAPQAYNRNIQVGPAAVLSPNGDSRHFPFLVPARCVTPMQLLGSGELDPVAPVGSLTGAKYMGRHSDTRLMKSTEEIMTGEAHNARK